MCTVLQGRGITLLNCLLQSLSKQTKDTLADNLIQAHRVLGHVDSYKVPAWILHSACCLDKQ